MATDKAGGRREVRSKGAGTRPRAGNTYRALIERSPDCIALLSHGGTIEYCNPAVKEVFGYSVDEFTGLPILELIHPADVAAAEQSLANLIETPDGTLHERLRIRHKDGTWRWAEGTVTNLLEDPDVRAVVAVWRDVTDTKRLEDDLRFVVQYANCLLWHATVWERPESPGVHWWDLKVFDEEAAQRFLPLDVAPGGGYPAALYRATLPEDRKRMDANSRASLRAGVAEYSQEFRCQRRDGEWRWIYEQAYIEPVAPGRFRVAGICMDVTDRKRAESELRKAGVAKDQFLAVLAHELRNPLAAIRNGVQVLRRSDGTRAIWTRTLEGLERQVHHQARLIDDLLDVARISAGKIRLQLEPVDLTRIVRQGLEDQHFQSQQGGLHLESNIPDHPVWVEGDPTRLAQILDNLLSNATKFTPAGGVISVSMEEVGDQVRLTVTDSGIGINPDLLMDLFQPFAQGERGLSRTRGGLGLGLALIKRLAELHGGAVSARSDGPDRGSEFSISLPTILAPEELASDGESHPKKISGRNVLIIEDNPDISQGLRDLLELQGFHVTDVASGSEGAEMARRLRPDVVLCDIGLPGLDGYAVARIVRNESDGRRPLLIAMTGYGQEEDRRKSREAGFDIHLVKPVDPRELERLLQIST